MSESELKSLYAQLLAERLDEPRDRCVSPDELRTVVEGSASSDERLRALEHVAACPPCQRELALLGTVAEAAGGRRSGIPRNWVLLAASVAAVALGVRVFQEGGVTGEGEDVLRGEAQAVHLVSPVDGARGGRVLIWKAAPGATRYEVELLDEAGMPVHGGVTRDTTFSVPETVDLPGGATFQWRVTGLRVDGSRVESEVTSFVAVPR